VYFYDVFKQNIHGCVSFCLCLLQEIDLPSFDRVAFESGGSVNEVSGAVLVLVLSVIKLFKPCICQ
jgi:hypothetical protein